MTRSEYDRQKFYVEDIFSFLEQTMVPVLIQDGIVAPGNTHTRSAPPLNSLTKVALKMLGVFSVELRLAQNSVGGASATSFQQFSFILGINAVMLWPVHVQKTS